MLSDPFPEAVRLLSALGFAVFRRGADGVLRASHGLPDWGLALFGVTGEQLDPREIADRFPVLDNFLVDANAVWSSVRYQPSVRSGIWQATDDLGRDYELEATALKIDDVGFLIVQNIALGGDAHRVLLQSGRDRMLELSREIRTYKELQIELNRARQNAEQLTQAKSDFLANMSHEVRTPLAGILGLASLLTETEQTADQAGYTQSIIDSARGLMRIVNDVLDFSRIESGKLQFEVSRFPLQEFVQVTADRFRPLAARANLTLNVHLTSPLPESIVGDALRLRQIIDNLLSNALKFTHRGSISIQVDSATLEENVPAICFSIRDTGIGIDPAHQRHVFESFAQADASTARKYGGTGLGLSIVRRLTLQMGGTVGLSSAVGVGSTFFVTIPTEVHVAGTALHAESRSESTDAESSHDVVAKSSDRNEGADREGGTERSDVAHRSTLPSASKRGGPGGVSSDESEEVRLPHPESLHVLLAEDHEINRMLVRKMLTRRGFRVREVSNGRGVLEALRVGDYDVVLMDCQMPEMDGFTATRAIRAHEQQSGEYVPIIAITAHAMAGFREKCLAEGMDGYISKPLQPEELARLVQTMATKRRRTGAARDTDHEL